MFHFCSVDSAAGVVVVVVPLRHLAVIYFWQNSATSLPPLFLSRSLSLSSSLSPSLPWGHEGSCKSVFYSSVTLTR